MGFVFYFYIYTKIKLVKRFLELINYKIVIGDSIIFTPKSIAILIVVFIVTSLLLKLLKRIIHKTLSNEAKIKFTSIFSFLNYFVYIIAILITFDTIGINVTAIFAASAALLVGIGLALQTFIQDIISGVFILADQSVHVGDIIEVDQQVGRVENIKLRTTRAVTRDNKVLIIPNHKFLTSILYNWTENGVITREHITVGVAYGSDVQAVRTILINIANEHESVLKTPSPDVLFDDFGDSALIMKLFFTINNSFRAFFVKSDLRYTIFEKFKEHKIEIPFPQRTVSYVNTPKSIQ